VAVLSMASMSHSQEPATGPDLQKELARLRAENQQLKTENEQLRQRLAKSATTRPYELRIDPYKLKNFREFGERLRITPRLPRLPSTSPYSFTLPDQRSVPNDWVPQQFNGQTFYLIPLAAESRPTAAVSR